MLLRLRSQSGGEGFDLWEGEASGLEGAAGEFARLSVANAWLSLARGGGLRINLRCTARYGSEDGLDGSWAAMDVQLEDVFAGDGLWRWEVED